MKLSEMEGTEGEGGGGARKCNQFEREKDGRKAEQRWKEKSAQTQRKREKQKDWKKGGGGREIDWKKEREKRRERGKRVKERLFAQFAYLLYSFAVLTFSVYEIEIDSHAGASIHMRLTLIILCRCYSL